MRYTACLIRWYMYTRGTSINNTTLTRFVWRLEYLLVYFNIFIVLLLASFASFSITCMLQTTKKKKKNKNINIYSAKHQIFWFDLQLSIQLSTHHNFFFLIIKSEWENTPLYGANFMLYFGANTYSRVMLSNWCLLDVDVELRKVSDNWRETTVNMEWNWKELFENTNIIHCI